MSQRLAALLGGIIALAAAASTARAGGVALVNPDRALEQAVGTALTPWAIDVMRVDADPPGASMPGAADRARAIAERVGVGAVVWITDDEGPALWIYDLDSHRVVARRLASSPPFDDATAAAAALSIKTMLRHSTVAPVEERYAAKLVLRRRPGDARIRYESIVVARLRDTEAGDLEPRLGAGVSWWPKDLDDRLGAAATVQSGPGIAIDEPDLVGRFSDTAVGLSARARLALGGRLRVAPELGVWLHLTSLDGAVISRNERAHVSRTNASIDAAAALQVRLAGDVFVAVRAGGAYMLRNQRYLVAGDPVLTLPSTEWEAGVGIELPLF